MNAALALAASAAFSLPLLAGASYAKEGSRVADESIRPFHVNVPEERLLDLRRRIAATRWPDKETVSDRSQGVQLAMLQELVRYWGTDYDWRKAEAKLNALPQFITNIDGIDIHFIHVKSRHSNALPVIITHGWPGSIIEQLKVIGPLTDPTSHGGSAEDAFDVVIPSLPGYGFSGKPTGTGWDAGRIARAWAELMKRLGYTRYVAQGGDWGSPISSEMARQASAGLLGIHINLPATIPSEVGAALAAGGPAPAGLSEKERAVFEALNVYRKANSSAYFTMLTARPQTVGYGATDSPAGLAAWILVHPGFAQWTYGADPTKSPTKDDVLDNITLYWLTNTATSAGRLYWENGGRSAIASAAWKTNEISLPVAITVFPEDVYRAPETWARRAYRNLIYFHEVNKGGHFAAGNNQNSLRPNSVHPSDPFGRSTDFQLMTKEFSIMKRTLSFPVWIRHSLGVALIIGVVIVMLHLPKPVVVAASAALVDEGPMPDLSGAIGWLNSEPLNRKSLHGKVVLVDFWTYTCINSLRPLPYVKAWATKYKDAGLVVIGAHTPEFSFEKQRENVENAVRELKVTYPIAIDSNYAIWRAFDNQYWPAQYIIDGKGRIRYHHFGEGEYGQIERAIQELLKENGLTGIDESAVNTSGTGVEASPDFSNERSPETYIGYLQAERFASPERLAHDSQKTYSPPAKPSLNQWGLSGLWKVGEESAVPQVAGGKIVFRFHSRDLHLVLAPAKDGRPARFKVTLDGRAPGDNCGSDATPDGAGEVREPRLYQLIRQKGPIQDRIFEIEFLDPGAYALDFTFG